MLRSRNATLRKKEKKNGNRNGKKETEWRVKRERNEIIRMKRDWKKEDRKEKDREEREAVVGDEKERKE